MLTGPLSFDDSILMRIYLNKCPWPDQRIKCVILGSHIAVENIIRCGMLCEKKRHLTQALEHPMDKVRPIKQDLVWQCQGRRPDRLHSRNSACAEVSVRQRY